MDNNMYTILDGIIVIFMVILVYIFFSKDEPEIKTEPINISGGEYEDLKTNCADGISSGQIIYGVLGTPDVVTKELPPGLKTIPAGGYNALFSDPKGGVVKNWTSTYRC